jgi:hypothetical protein
MKALLFYFALFIGQLPTLQDKPVVHMRAHQTNIPIEFGGDVLEFMNAASIVQLPQLAPATDQHGRPWEIEVRNLGPGTLTILGKAQFSVQVAVGQTVQIKSANGGYTSVR